MIKTEALDTFQITGRGTVFVVPWFDVSEDEWWNLNGTEIEIDGVEYRISGVERWLVHRDRAYPLHKGKPMSLLVKPIVHAAEGERPATCPISR